MGWHLDGQILPDAGPAPDLESLRAFGPSVVEEDDGTLRMWYSGHDGSTARILEERSPCLLRLRDGSLRLWFAGRPAGDVSAAYRLCSASFTGDVDWLSG